MFTFRLKEYSFLEIFTFQKITVIITFTTRKGKLCKCIVRGTESVPRICRVIALPIIIVVVVVVVVAHDVRILN